MSRFARGMAKGTRVRQGEIIGYVGTTGRSTGPHLHYEVLVNGKQVNPLSIEMGTEEALEGDDLKRFMDERARIDELMSTIPMNAPVEVAGAITLRGSRSE